MVNTKNSALRQAVQHSFAIHYNMSQIFEVSTYIGEDRDADETP